jgi:hypothetical protein
MWDRLIVSKLMSCVIPQYWLVTSTENKFNGPIINVGPLINSSTHQLIPSSTHQPINSSPHPLINPSTHQPINPSTHQPINPSTHQPINPSTHQLINSSPLPFSSTYAKFIQNTPRIRSCAHLFC